MALPTTMLSVGNPDSQKARQNALKGPSEPARGCEAPPEPNLLSLMQAARVIGEPDYAARSQSA
jgi:hypothetical protein